DPAGNGELERVGSHGPDYRIVLNRGQAAVELENQALLLDSLGRRLGVIERLDGHLVEGLELTGRDRPQLVALRHAAYTYPIARRRANRYHRAPITDGWDLAEDRPPESVHAETEGVPRRVEEHPEGCAGLVRMLGRAEIEHRRLGGVEGVDDHIEMHLLGHLLTRPPGRDEALHMRKGDPPAGVRAALSPVGGAVDLPIQHRTGEPRESPRIGTVDDEAWEACNSHASHGMRRYRQLRGGVRDLPEVRFPRLARLRSAGGLGLSRRAPPRSSGRWTGTS